MQDIHIFSQSFGELPSVERKLAVSIEIAQEFVKKAFASEFPEELQVEAFEERNGEELEVTISWVAGEALLDNTLGLFLPGRHTNSIAFRKSRRFLIDTAREIILKMGAA